MNIACLTDDVQSMMVGIAVAIIAGRAMDLVTRAKIPDLTVPQNIFVDTTTFMNTTLFLLLVLQTPESALKMVWRKNYKILQI